MNDLKTDDGQSVEVIRPGQHNTNAGPDFFNAQLRIDGTLWAGNVEIHIRSSDWHRHFHHNDPSYDSCILHVVFENDASTLRMNGSHIPAIELKNKLPPYLWENYLKLIGTRGWISCQSRINEIDDNTWQKTTDRMILERLEQKTQQILVALKGNKDDWEESFYQQLARNFGFQLNAMPFEMLARSLPLKVIGKERSNLLNIESLIFGQAGMLEEKFMEGYPLKLQETYLHLANKYSLKNISHSCWKYLRLRPVNFPAIRLAQFSAILFSSPSLFRHCIESNNVNTLTTYFNVQASEYWNTHYNFNKTSEFQVKKLGKSSLNNLLINTIVPFLFSWGKYSGNSSSQKIAMDLLLSLPAEENQLINRWKELGINVHSAVDTQALIQLKIGHCSEKKCLTCAIGNKLINHLP